MRPAFRTTFSLLLILVFILSACQSTTTVPPTRSPEPGPPLPPVFTSTPIPSTATLPPKPSTTPARSLVVCLGQEPTSLYVYGSSSRGMWSVLEALYDGPFDTRKFTPVPVILTRLPALPDQGAVLETVEVKAGDMVVDANGNLASLAAGTRVLPTACSGVDCAQVWDGQKMLRMDRLKVTFQLLAGLKWSDGMPLTAADSVYSFKLASDPATKVSKQIIDRTASYVARDDTTVEWQGLPGYLPARFDGLFFIPLPRHAWEKYSPAEMANKEDVARRPLGWGPYILEEWKPGNYIRLRRNPAYFRAGEGLPKFDVLLYRFLGEPGDNNLAALQSGECDIVDQTTLLEDQLVQIIDLESQKKLRAYIGQGPEWEHLDFGIRPSSYDDGYTAGKDRPDFFGDVRVRQAIAYCIDRPTLVKTLLLNRSVVSSSYLPPGHPLALADLTPLPYDVEAGNRLLSEAGWKDADNNPATPRTAQGAANVPAGTSFSIDYYTTQAVIRQKTAEQISRNLGDCGVEVKLHYLSPGELYAAGPDGVLFGRKYDLAQFSWEIGSQPPCSLFESSSVPGPKNNWIGGNLSGYTSAAFDSACQKARQARPTAAAYAQAHQEAMRILAKDLPVIPLYYPLKIAISRADLCNLEMDVSTRSFLWNLERLDINSACRT